MRNRMATTDANAIEEHPKVAPGYENVLQTL